MTSAATLNRLPNLHTLKITTEKCQYRLSCYGPNEYIFSIPLHTIPAWLRQSLGRTATINGEPLTPDQITMLRAKLPPGIEVGWSSQLKYFVEGSWLSED